MISENRAELYYDPKRLLPHGDPKSVFSTVAMGIFIEHLSIAASKFDYDVKIEKFIIILILNQKEIHYLQLLP